MFKTLFQPFPFPDRTSFQKLRTSFFEALGVALFFLAFQPFGMSSWQNENKIWHFLAYGAIVGLVTAFYRLVFPLFFPSQYREEKWVVWKEIVGGVLVLVMITMAILIYHNWYFGPRDTVFQNFGVLFIVVALIGSIPISISVLSRYVYLYRKFSRVAGEINLPVSGPEIIILRADNEKDFLRLDSESLFYIESADNYCSVLYFSDGGLKKELIRSSLSRLESQIDSIDIVRCHRSYIVNMQKVVSVSGNAQGYRLLLSNISEIIPVARKYSHLVDSIRP